MRGSLSRISKNLGWDEPIPSDLHKEWEYTITMFLQIGEIKCNNWGKTVMVTARLINGLICTDRTKICTAPTVKEIKLA